MCCLQETHFKCKDTKRLKVKEWKKDYSTNQKKASVAINIKLISEESVSGQRESFHDDSLRVHNYKCSCMLKPMKQNRISKRNRQIHNLEEFNTPLSIIDKVDIKSVRIKKT